jgi:hypothetical protein
MFLKTQRYKFYNPIAKKFRKDYDTLSNCRSSLFCILAETF